VEARARAVLRLHGACGWTAPDGVRAPLNSPVRLLTEALEHGTRAARAAKHTAFVAEAMGPTASAAAAAAAARRLRTQLLPALWRLRWENACKETYWLLTLDGLRVGGRVAHAPLPCELCGGGAVASRAHMLWECPPAVAVRGALQQALARRGCAVVLERPHVWLMHCPDPALHADLWRVACLAAVRAMERGRATAWAVAHVDSHPLPADLAADIACRVALADLAASVADFAALGACRPAARACVLPPQRPFFWVGHPHRAALRVAS